MEMNVKTLKMLTLSLTLAGSLAAPMTAHAGEFRCNVTRVLEWNDRVDVACSNSININGAVISYFAISKADTTRAQRWISLATSALLSGNPFYTYFDDSGSTNLETCSSWNCRTPITFGIQK